LIPDWTYFHCPSATLHHLIFGIFPSQPYLFRRPKMRIIIKGGVWKNTEDEILKAAVMKYGLNQWARISSLLVRKSAKQCKARWYEWLDPSIKKTEWSREEEEKLLHLAKLMPTQWRTIAPIVGRTPAQCLEHYEKLLDAAQQKEVDVADDPRRLRPGEIDPQPETKPARPDPVDMDEDEKEMLSEARARLANTRGKKAKRKAREKQLEEARRLAALQKKRELKAAGLHIPEFRRRMRGIDYNKEIPFQKQVPAGFYDTSRELAQERKRRSDPNFVPIALQRLESRRRDEEEERQRKTDARKMAVKKMKDLPAAIEQINRLNDPAQTLHRTRLNLPAPQIGDAEMEEIAKLGAGSQLPAIEGGSAATHLLLADYAAIPAPTPLRTPARDVRTPARQDTVMLEAQNLVALTHGDTPLKGGENTPLHPSDFTGITPRRAEVQTPNALVLATPGRAGDGGATPVRGRTAKPTASTPARGQSAPTPLRTPIRDDLRINEPMEESSDPASTPLIEKQRQRALWQHLRMGLSALPAPSNEYKLLMPEIEDEDDDDATSQMVEDTEDALQRKRDEVRAREEAKLRLRSQVLKNNLPRPLGINRSFLEAGESVGGDELQQADAEIRREMLLILTHEAIEYPIKGGEAPKVHSQYDQLSEDELSAARSLLMEEMATLIAENGRAPPDVYERIWNRIGAEWIYVPSKKCASPLSDLSNDQKVDALKARLDALQANAKKETTKAAKLEKRLTIYNGGYQQRATALQKEIMDLYMSLDKATVELRCFASLKAMEERAKPARLAILDNELHALRQREETLQQRFAQLSALKH